MLPFSLIGLTSYPFHGDRQPAVHCTETESMFALEFLVRTKISAFYRALDFQQSLWRASSGYRFFELWFACSRLRCHVSISLLKWQLSMLRLSVICEGLVKTSRALRRSKILELESPAKTLHLTVGSTVKMLLKIHYSWAIA